MDIAELSMAMSQNRVMNDFGVAMLSNSLDMVEDTSAALTGMMDNSMELSVNPDLGSNIDIRL
ncbi:MAG: YjfB family protein [Butyrivibrio sp.]|nr:YjfB family protein [Butyrivibrio sp.]